MLRRPIFKIRFNSISADQLARGAPSVIIEQATGSSIQLANMTTIPARFCTLTYCPSALCCTKRTQTF
jgi:hypothetical protein